MAKRKIISEDGANRPTESEIEEFVLEQGSDSLGIFGGRFEGGIHGQQVPDEFAACVTAILATGKPVRSYLEIGAAAGGSTFLFHHFLHPEKIVLIDDDKHHRAGLRAKVLEGIPHREVVGNSAWPETLKRVRDLGFSYDLILVDAAHDYASAKLDVVLYRPFLKPGGLLLLHDTVYAPGGVGRIMRELKEDEGMEFIGEYVSEKYPKCGAALFRKAEE
jgi:predicted O-methyltransferase YrrM